MYGPAAAMPPQAPPPSPGAAVITLRVIFCAVTLLSFGMLAWTAMLRIAIMRQSRKDWVLFTLSLPVTIGFLSLFDERWPEWVANIGMALLFLLSVSVFVHYLLADKRHYAQAQAPMPAAQPVYGYAAQTPPYSPPAPPVQPAAPVQNPYVQTAPAQRQPTPTLEPPIQAPRIAQVRAELDELSDLLRKEQGPGR